MTSDTEFDWEAVELEEKRSRGNLSREDYLKLGYLPEHLDAYEATFDRINTKVGQNNMVKGTVLLVSEDSATVDINTTEDAYIDLSKEDKRYLNYIQPGHDITVKVVGDPEEKGYINASFTAAAKAMKEQEVLNSIGEDVAYMGKVDRLVSGGYVVILDDIETFMPGSLAGVNKLYDFNILLDREILVKPVNFERGNIVVSHREYLRTLIPGKIEQLKENMDQSVTGFVTGTTKYGVFCEFNECLTGMILVNDLTDEWKEKHANQQIKPGDSIDFYVKEIISTKKIILTQILKYDPWSDIDERYTIPCHTEGTITSIKEYGAFIKFDDEIVGLLHSSELEGKELTEGEKILVQITRIDKSTKKVFLTLPKEND